MQSRQSVSEPSQSAPGLAAALPAVLINLGLLYGTSALAEMSAEELAKLAQNPVGNLMSIPFQNNTNLNFGPEMK